MVNKKIVCLGGGIGTVNLIKGLKDYFSNINVVVSMADDGGSSGRLRRLYNIPPPGDLVSCMSALIRNNESPLAAKLLTYRFKGDRYGKDKELGGQKLGNLIMTAMLDITGNFGQAIELFKKTFNVEGNFLPATIEAVSISARTTEGKMIHGEEIIDTGKYKGKRVLEKVFLNPIDAKANPKFIKSIRESDIIIAGPGDLYTTILPVLIIKGVREMLNESQARKIFIVNVANKPFETKGYNVSDYVLAVKRHLGYFPFDKIVVNDNYAPKIPKDLKYKYVDADGFESNSRIALIKSSLVNSEFPLYHNSQKLAKTIMENI